jgi:hypothetical protein
MPGGTERKRVPRGSCSWGRQQRLLLGKRVLVFRSTTWATSLSCAVERNIGTRFLKRSLCCHPIEHPMQGVRLCSVSPGIHHSSWNLLEPLEFPEYSLNVPWDTSLTLVLGTHVGKLYSATTLVLSLGASCSWDGGPMASASTQPELSLCL